MIIIPLTIGIGLLSLSNRENDWKTCKTLFTREGHAKEGASSKTNEWREDKGRESIFRGREKTSFLLRRERFSGSGPSQQYKEERESWIALMQERRLARTH